MSFKPLDAWGFIDERGAIASSHWETLNDESGGVCKKQLCKIVTGVRI